VHIYGEITKAEERDDGSLFVAGYASSEVVDSAGEVIKSSAIEAALPDFFKYGTGPLREMHQNIAAGGVEKAEVQNDGKTYIEAIVVDPVSINKVKKGVLKGFSVGGKCMKRDDVDKTIITEMRLTEISLVDRPCNPEAVITMAKADYPADETPAAQPDIAALIAESIAKAMQPFAERLDAIEKAKKADDEDDKKDDKKDDDKDGEYGDVEYADKKNDKYPIDTEKHIRAAWSYINMPKNQKDYTTAEVDAIKANIVAAWKKKIDKDGPPSEQEDDESEKSERAGTIRKAFRLLADQGIAKRDGAIKKALYSVADLADMLNWLGWVQAECVSECAYEGDDSDLPQKLADLARQMGDILIEMAQEEVGELIAGMKDGKGGSAAVATNLDELNILVECSAFAGDLKKRAAMLDIVKYGARNSADDQDRLDQAHDLLVDMGANCPGDEDEDDKPSEDEDDDDAKSDDDEDKPQKSHSHKHDHGSIEKVSGQLGTLRKSYNKLEADNAELKKSLETLQKKFDAMPAPGPRGPLRAIGKGEEINPIGEPAEVAPVKTADGKGIDDAATEMKKVFAGGGSRISGHFG